MNNHETNPLREELIKKLNGVKSVHLSYFTTGEVRGVESAIRAVNHFFDTLQSQSLPAEQPETEGKHVCCGMIKNPDTGQYQKEPHDLCGWGCQPTWEPSQPEGKTLEEEIKDKAETYAGMMLWLNQHNKDSHLFQEYIAEKSYIAGATEYANQPRKEWIEIADFKIEPRIRYNVWDGLIVDDAYMDFDGKWKYTQTSEELPYPITHIQPLPTPPQK